MKELTDAVLMSNYDKWKNYVDTYCKSRKDYININQLCDEMGEYIATAPASNMESYHCCYVGGLIEHSLNVIENILFIRKYFDMKGVADLPSIESCVFVAAFHDVGKAGDGDRPYFIPEESQWHRDKLGRLFKYNTEQTYLTHAEQTLYLFSKYCISITAKEFQAIRAHDGAWVSYNDKYNLSTLKLLSYMLQFADMQALVIEKHKD